MLQSAVCARALTQIRENPLSEPRKFVSLVSIASDIVTPSNTHIFFPLVLLWLIPADHDREMKHDFWLECMRFRHSTLPLSAVKEEHSHKSFEHKGEKIRSFFFRSNIIKYEPCLGTDDNNLK
jgi:hypothetical protein